MKKYKHYLIISTAAISALTSFTACTPIRPAQPANYAAENLDIHEKLSDTANAIEKSLRTLAEAQETEAMNAINTCPLITCKGGMGGRTNLDWSGPIEPLLHEIARRTDYKVKVLGNTPAIPVIVSITAENRMVADIVKDAGLQAGKRANLVVYPGSRIIELRYAPVC